MTSCRGLSVKWEMTWFSELWNLISSITPVCERGERRALHSKEALWSWHTQWKWCFAESLTSSLMCVCGCVHAVYLLPLAALLCGGGFGFKAPKKYLFFKCLWFEEAILIKIEGSNIHFACRQLGANEFTLHCQLSLLAKCTNFQLFAKTRSQQDS